VSAPRSRPRTAPIARASPLPCLSIEDLSSGQARSGGDGVLNGIDLPPAIPTGRLRAGQELGRSGPGELAEVADQMRLVGIAGVGRDPPRPATRARPGAATPRRSGPAGPRPWGRSPSCRQNRAIKCRWLQPTSSAIRPIGTAPPVATSRSHAQPTSGEGRGPQTSRRSRNRSINANRCRQLGVSRSCSPRRRPAAPSTSTRSTIWPASLSMGRPKSV
jgi:hypothetical protein